MQVCKVCNISQIDLSTMDYFKKNLEESLECGGMHI